MKFLLALIALALVATGIFVVFFAPVPAATSGDENPAVFVEKDEAADDVETMASGDLADVGAAGARELIEADVAKKGYVPGIDAWFVC